MSASKPWCRIRGTLALDNVTVAGKTPTAGAAEVETGTPSSLESGLAQ